MKQSLFMASLMALALTACGNPQSSSDASPAPADKAASSATGDTSTVAKLPAEIIDLSHWNITVPTDVDGNGKVDIVKIADIKTYSHPDYFYVNADGEVVFASPNKALTTANSSNTRSELRYMSRGSNTKIKTHAPGNNFSLRAHPNSDAHASIGGRMEASFACGPCCAPRRQSRPSRCFFCRDWTNSRDKRKRAIRRLWLW